MMKKGLMIAGTGTEVGKTIVTASIAAAWQKEKKSFLALKPVASGCEIEGGDLISSDAEWLRKSQGLGLSARDIICPWRYELAISPLSAARLHGDVIRIQDISNHCQRHRKDRFLVIEGAGGIASPVSEDGNWADLAQQLNLAIILVSPVGLGSFHSLVTTLSYIKEKELSLLGIILNDFSDPSSLRSQCFLDEIKECKLPVPVYLFPKIAKLNIEEMASQAEKHFPLESWWNGEVEKR